MESAFHYVAPPGQCGYLPEQTWRLEYELVSELTPAEYLERMLQGWRRFGFAMFRPRCPACSACRSLRVVVDRFVPNRSQRRVRKLNEGAIRLRVGVPTVTPAKLELYDRYHAFQSQARGWPIHPTRDKASYLNSFVENPFPIEEWCYYLGTRLAGVGYVDSLPEGLSAVYFFYDPELRQRSLGTWNVLSVLEQAGRRRLPYVYLGYYVAGCQSMEYKLHFLPNQLLGKDGQWR
jgi:arginine-tRNA-protein transferase